MDFLQASARILAGILQTLAIRPVLRTSPILGRFRVKNGAPEGGKFAFLAGLGYDVICELWNPGAVAALPNPFGGLKRSLLSSLSVYFCRCSSIKPLRGTETTWSRGLS